MLTNVQVQLVQDSFAHIRNSSESVANLFYTRLFQIAPHTRSMFTSDMVEQGRKLMNMLTTVVFNLRNLDVILPAARALGERHVGYNVLPEHYDIVGAALLWTLEQGLGSRYTPEVADAWAAAYTLLADVMKESYTATA